MHNNHSNNQSNSKPPSVIMNTPLVPTLGRPPSIKIAQQLMTGAGGGGGVGSLGGLVDPSAPGGVVMNARAPNAMMAVRMKVAGGGVVLPSGSSNVAGQRVGSGGGGSVSGRGRGAGHSSGSKPPPGAVNLERSYQICQAVIQNSPNRHQLKCQLKPPPPTGGAGGKETSMAATAAATTVSTVTNVPVMTDTQNPMVTSSNRLVRIGGGVAGVAGVVSTGKQILVPRPGMVVVAGAANMVGNNGPSAGQQVMTDTSSNVPRASSAPPGQQFPVSGWRRIRRGNGLIN